jgi:tetratricopeptide (TPR) repeat protein
LVTLDHGVCDSHPRGPKSRVFRQFIHRFSWQARNAILQIRSTAIQPLMDSELPIEAERRKAVGTEECPTAGPAGPPVSCGEYRMKSVSRFALAIAAAALTVGATSTGWAADEKPKKQKASKVKPAEPAKLVLSKGFETAYNAVVGPYTKDAAVSAYGKEAAKNPAAKPNADVIAAANTAKAGWPGIKAAIANEDDRYQAGNFAQSISTVLGDRDLRIEAMDLLTTSTRTPESEKRTAYYIRGAIAYDAQDWPTAISSMQKSYDMGFRQNAIEGGLEILVADALAQQKKYPEALDWMKKSEEGSKVAGAKPLPGNFDSKAARFALNTKDYNFIGPWMLRLVKKNPTPDYWHDSLMQAYNYVELDSQETLDLMRLLRTVGGMKYQQNYSAYATDSIAAFFPTEVKAVLDEGFASGTITKSNATFGGLYNDVTEKLKVDPISPADLDKDLASAKSGYDATATGDIAYSIGDYARAKTAYEAALAKGGIVDRAGKNETERTIMRLGLAKMKLGDNNGARAELAKIAAPGRKVVAEFWLAYLDQMDKKAAAPAA